MKGIYNIFTESGGVFSWRKAGTAIVFIVFAYAVIGFCHKHNFDELPGSYLGIIAGVFGFYFFKDVINNITVKTVSNETIS